MDQPCTAWLGCLDPGKHKGPQVRIWDENALTDSSIKFKKCLSASPHSQPFSQCAMIIGKFGAFQHMIQSSRSSWWIVPLIPVHDFDANFAPEDSCQVQPFCHVCQRNSSRNMMPGMLGLLVAHQTRPLGPLWNAMDVGLSDSNFSTVLFECTPRGPSFLNNYGLSGYPLQINVAGKTDIGCSKKTDADTVPCVKRVTCLKIPAGFPDSSASSSSIKALEPWFLPVSTSKNDGFCPDKM